MALNLLYEGLCCVLPIRRLRRDWTYHAKCTRLYVFRWIKQHDWATVTLYYKVTKTALAGFASRFHIVSSLFSLRCVYIIHRLRWVSAFSFSCVVMSIFSSSSLCVWSMQRANIQPGRCLCSIDIYTIHIEPHRSSASYGCVRIETDTYKHIHSVDA